MTSHLSPPGLAEHAQDGWHQGQDDDGRVLQLQGLAQEGNHHQLGEDVGDEVGGDEVPVGLRGDLVLKPVEEEPNDAVASRDHGGQREYQDEHDHPGPRVVWSLLEHCPEAAQCQLEHFCHNSLLTEDSFPCLLVLALLLPLLREPVDAVLQEDEGVEEGGHCQPQGRGEQRHVAKLLLDPRPDGQPHQPADTVEGINDGEAGGALLLAGDVADVALGGQEEDDLATGDFAETLKHEELHAQLQEPDSVDEVDKVEGEVTDDGEEDEGLPAVGVREGAGEQGEDDSWNILQGSVFGLDGGQIFRYVWFC